MAKLYSPVRRNIRSILIILFGTSLLLLISAVKGPPSVFVDTAYYIEQGHNVFSDPVNHMRPGSMKAFPSEAKASNKADYDNTTIATRSAFYGAFLYLTQGAGTIWLTAALQAAIGSWLVFLLCKVGLSDAPLWIYYAVQSVVALGSTLPFFSAFMMPDVFAGYAVICVSLTLVYFDILSRTEKMAIGALLVLSMTFHTTHLLDIAALLLVAMGLLGALRMAPTRLFVRGGLLTIAIGCALGLNTARNEAYKYFHGTSISAPPFLTARVLADGPGRKYLRYACSHGVQYVLCRFQNLPLDDSDKILWSRSAAEGIFQAYPPEIRSQIQHEEPRFVLQAILYDPVDQIVASFGNYIKQLGRPDLDEPLQDQRHYLTEAEYSSGWLPILINNANRVPILNSAEWLGVPLSVFGPASMIMFYVFGAVTIVYVTNVLWKNAQSRRGINWYSPTGRIVVVLMLLTIGVLINAFFCGVFSGVFPRYQARVSWLMTLGAALAAADYYRGRVNLRPAKETARYSGRASDRDAILARQAHP